MDARPCFCFWHFFPFLHASSDFSKLPGKQLILFLLPNCQESIFLNLGKTAANLWERQARLHWLQGVSWWEVQEIPTWIFFLGFPSKNVVQNKLLSGHVKALAGLLVVSWSLEVSLTGTETSPEHLELGIFIFLTPLEYFPCDAKGVYREQQKQWEIFQSVWNLRPQPDLAEL